MGLTAENITQLTEAGESETVEFKGEHETQPDLGETLAAFANQRGGVLLIGVNDDGAVMGVSRRDRTESKLRAAARSCNPPLEHIAIYTVKVGDKDIVVGELPTLSDSTYEQIYSYNGVMRQRRGAENNLMTSADITALAMRRRGSYDEQVLPDCQLADLDAALTKQLLSGRLRLGRSESATDDVPTYLSEEGYGMLLSMRAIRSLGGKLVPTVAGMLLLTEHPQLHPALRDATVQCGRFKDERMEFIDRADFSGPISQQLTAAIQFVARNTRLASRIEGLEREDIPQFPPVAVREAVVNALMHRDYQVAAKVNINIFSDRLEVINPGSLLPTLTLDHLEGTHVLRNRELGTMMLWLRLAEAFGTGIRRMKAAMREAGLPEPRFESWDGWFRVTLYSRLPDDEAPANVAPTKQTFSGRGTVGAPLAVNLNRRQQDLLRFLGESGRDRINAQEYCERYNVKRTQGVKDLRELVEYGLLERVGGSKNVTYILLAPAKGSQTLV